MRCSRCDGSGVVTVPDFGNAVDVPGFGPLPGSKIKPCPECERVKAAVAAERERGVAGREPTALEAVVIRTVRAVLGQRPAFCLEDGLDEIVVEVERLRALNEGLAERVARQSELLS